jgi:hypothetical protein
VVTGPFLESMKETGYSVYNKLSVLALVLTRPWNDPQRPEPDLIIIKSCRKGMRDTENDLFEVCV